jgi:hypothetical protein
MRGHPIGTGPFKIGDFKPNEYIVVHEGLLVTPPIHGRRTMTASHQLSRPRQGCERIVTGAPKCPPGKIHALAGVRLAL